MGKYIGRPQFLAMFQDIVAAETLEMIEDAYCLSKYAHRVQKRDSGERYFEHPKSVALIVIKELGIFDPEIVIMALLHDVIEDTFILSRSGMGRLFGQRVRNGLDYLTKVAEHDEYVRKMYECDDAGVIIVKLADRLHNLRTLLTTTPEKRNRKIEETRHLYLPFADYHIEHSDGEMQTALISLKEMINAKLISLES